MAGVSHPCFFANVSHEFDMKNCATPLFASYSRFGWGDNIDAQFSRENKADLLDAIEYFYSKFTDFGDVVRAQKHGYMTQWQKDRMQNHSSYDPLLLDSQYLLPTGHIREKRDVETEVMACLESRLSAPGFQKVGFNNAFARKRREIPSFDCLDVVFDKYAHYVTIYCYYWSDLQKSILKKYGRFYPLQRLDVMDGKGWPQRIKTDDIQKVDVGGLIADRIAELGRRYSP